MEEAMEKCRTARQTTDDATKGWRKPTADELKLNLNMLPDVYIPATPPSLS